MKNNQYSKYSPEEIFEIFKEQHRLASPLDPIADETFELTKETVIVDLQDAQDLLPWQEWTEWLNQCYGIEANRVEWKEVVKPTTEKTLWDVCLFISERAEKEEVKPIKLLGNECLSSAVFLTLKKNLKIKGANVDNLRPSTNISEYLDNNDNFSPLLEEATLTGVRTFEELTYGKLETERRFKYWIDKIIPNVIYKRPLKTGNLVTFGDLVNRIIENNKLGTTLYMKS
ncbi:hypothetical protein [Flagellimonas amphidinii]|nr:hypothetical protein [Allomuricauda amphidinii]MDC6367220.1 hypothetical protein [Muricauda sp. AC10]